MDLRSSLLLDGARIVRNQPLLYDLESQSGYTGAQFVQHVHESMDWFDARGRKQLVFAFCRNDYDSVRTYCAALESGHAIALLDDRMPESFKRQLIDIYRPDCVTMSRRGIGLDLSFDAYRSEEQEGSVVWKSTRPFAEALYPDLCILLTTSGSTGSPKLVRLSTANVFSNSQSIAEALGLNTGDRTATSLPFHYSFGLSVLNTYLVTGGFIVLTNTSPVEREFWSAFSDHQCTSFSGVPFSYQILDRIGITSWALPSLNTMTQAGGHLDSKYVARFCDFMRRRHGRFFVMYGQTEATARMSILPPELLPEKLGSAGKVIPGGSLSIEDDHNAESQPDIEGEVVYHGPNVMLGYATARSCLAKGNELGNVLRTGDLGRVDSDGCLWITGRLKRCAKINGQRVNLDELESLLHHHAPAAAVSDDTKVVIFCEQADPTRFDQYRREIATTLRMHHRLFEFKAIDALPRTGSNKVDYGRLTSIAAL